MNPVFTWQAHSSVKKKAASPARLQKRHKRRVMPVNPGGLRQDNGLCREINIAGKQSNMHSQPIDLI
jgi:hypothetical protein